MSSTLDVEDFRPRSTVSHEPDAIQQYIRDCKRLKPNFIIMVLERAALVETVGADGVSLKSGSELKMIDQYW
jgi:hypothetical protein